MEYKIIDVKELSVFRKRVKEIDKGVKAVVIAKDDEFNRKVLEFGEIEVLLFRDFSARKDRLKQRDSGLNEVLCKIAKKNSIKIGFDFSFLNHGDDFHSADVLGKIMQSIKLCKKCSVEVIIFYENKHKKDLNGLLLTIGMDTKMAKKTIEGSFEFYR